MGKYRHREIKTFLKITQPVSRGVRMQTEGAICCYTVNIWSLKPSAPYFSRSNSSAEQLSAFTFPSEHLHTCLHTACFEYHSSVMLRLWRQIKGLSPHISTAYLYCYLCLSFFLCKTEVIIPISCSCGG